MTSQSLEDSAEGPLSGEGLGTRLACGGKSERGHLSPCAPFRRICRCSVWFVLYFQPGMLSICRWTLEGSVTASCFQEPFQLPLWAVSARQMNNKERLWAKLSSWHS